MNSSHRQASIIIGIGLIVVSIVLVIYAFKLPKVNNLELEDYSSSTVTSAASSISSTDDNSTAFQKQNSVVDKTTVINETQSQQNVLTTNVEYPINLNSCSLEELTTIDGIGETRAQAILDYRDYLGGYTSVSQLKDIKGIGDATFAKIKDQFKAGCLSEDEILTTIKTCFNETGYLLDTHTAIGYGVLKQYQQETGDHTKTVLLSTASPYKFPESVYQAIYGEELDVYTAIDKLSEKTGVPVPQALAGIKEREVLHKEAIDKTEIISFIKSEIEAM